MSCVGAALLLWWFAEGILGDKADTSTFLCEHDIDAVRVVLGVIPGRELLRNEGGLLHDDSNCDDSSTSKQCPKLLPPPSTSPWPALHHLAALLREELSAAAGSGKAVQRVRREKLSRFLHLAVGVWAVACRSRTCVLLDSQFPACATNNAARLASAVGIGLTRFVSNHTWLLSAEDFPLVVSLEDNTVLLLVHRLKLMAMLSAAVICGNDSSLYVNVCPRSAANGEDKRFAGSTATAVFLHGDANKLARKTIRLSLCQMLTHLSSHCRLIRSCPLALELATGAVVSSPGALVTVVGKLLDYPVIYALGADLRATSNNGNCLSGAPLALASLDLDLFSLQVAQTTQAEDITIVSFSSPESVYNSQPLVRCLIHRFLSRTRKSVLCALPTGACCREATVTIVVVDHVAL